LNQPASSLSEEDDVAVSNSHVVSAHVLFDMVPHTTKYTLTTFDVEHNHELDRIEYKHLSKAKKRLTYNEQMFIIKVANANIGAVRAHNLYIGLKGSSSLVHERQKFTKYFSFDYFVEDAELCGLFWAAEVAKGNYKEFGDIVSFDATYKTNKRSVTVGSGLLKKETTEAYGWLLKAFKKAFVHAPNIVVTDQDEAMRLAVAAEFPESKHRLCMWHIMQKIPSNIVSRIYDDTNFKDKFGKIVWNMFSGPEEFEHRWNKLMEEFNLVNHKWLSKMYRLRSSWIPAFFVDSPLCGLLRTTSRNAHIKCKAKRRLIRLDQEVAAYPNAAVEINSSPKVILQTPVPQDKWLKEKDIELVNIIGEPLASITTRSRAKDFDVASAHECLYVNFLSKMEPKKLIKSLEEEGWIIAMEEELNQLKKTRKISEEVYVQQHPKVMIFYDNTIAIAISNNPVLYSRTKHIDIRYHFIINHILKGDIELHFVSTNLQLADILTKPLAVPSFTRLVAELSMLNIEKQFFGRWPATTTSGRRQKTFPAGFFRRTQIYSRSPDLSDLLYHSPSLAATSPLVHSASAAIHHYPAAYTTQRHQPPLPSTLTAAATISTTAVTITSAAVTTVKVVFVSGYTNSLGVLLCCSVVVVAIETPR
nr:hypothetical protein [Tanacetum cinerariifolium]